MRTAIVSPVEYLFNVQPFSSYHLVLTHLVIHNHRYQEFYRQRSKAGEYVILDNGAVEKNGHSVPMRDVVTAAMLIKPTVVVLPDFLFDGERTLDELESTAKSPGLRFLKRIHPEVKIAVVVQGIDRAEWLESFDVLNGIDGVDLLCIPKVTAQTFGTRWKALELVKRRVRKPCHLLGSWWQATLDDVKREAAFPFVQGIDTPKPIRLAVQGKSLAQWNELEHDRSFLDRRHDEKVDLELLKRNCAEFVELCKGG